MPSSIRLGREGICSHSDTDQCALLFLINLSAFKAFDKLRQSTPHHGHAREAVELSDLTPTGFHPDADIKPTSSGGASSASLLRMNSGVGVPGQVAEEQMRG